MTPLDHVTSLALSAMNALVGVLIFRRGYIERNNMDMLLGRVLIGVSFLTLLYYFLAQL